MVGEPCDAELTAEVSCLDSDGNFTIEATLWLSHPGGAAFSNWGSNQPGLDILSGESPYLAEANNQFTGALSAGDNTAETDHNADNMEDPTHHEARSAVTLEGYIEWGRTRVDVSETVPIPDSCPSSGGGGNGGDTGTEDEEPEVASEAAEVAEVLAEVIEDEEEVRPTAVPAGEAGLLPSSGATGLVVMLLTGLGLTLGGLRLRRSQL